MATCQSVHWNRDFTCYSVDLTVLTRLTRGMRRGLVVLGNVFLLFFLTFVFLTIYLSISNNMQQTSKQVDNNFLFPMKSVYITKANLHQHMFSFLLHIQYTCMWPKICAKVFSTLHRTGPWDLLLEDILSLSKYLQRKTAQLISLICTRP